MCGIAGIVVAKDEKVPIRTLRAMTRTLSARGPDEEGFHVDEAGGAGLGHRRLSIVDLSTGKQPLSNGDGSIVVIANGEIYNFPTLRPTLERRGHTFRTHSDCETIVWGYEEWGEEVFAQLQGMFAIALWDARRRRLYLARDRMGKKPLYYAFLGPTKSTLVFGSELKALLAHPDLDRTVSPTRLASYLTYECLPESESILEGVNKVMPGSFLRFEREEARAKEKRFWSMRFAELDSVPDLARWDEERIATELRDRIRQATKDRLMSDVPLGVFLSGGIDSSTVAAAMAEVVPARQIKTFSITFDDPSFDESDYAKKVAKHLGTDHSERRLSPRAMLDVLPRVAGFMCEPLGDASIIPTHLLSRFARETVKVALGGDGGDELFLGYPTFQADAVARQLDRSLSLGAEKKIAGGLSALAKLLPVSDGNFGLDFKVKRFAQGLGYPARQRHQAWMGSFTPEELADVFSEQYRPLALARHPYAILNDLFVDADPRDHYDEMVLQYARLYLTGCVLTKVDRASMACGLEVRAPLLDTRVVEFACAIPGAMKLSGFRTKHILKQAVRPWLPRDIIDRPKKGFGIPVAQWLRGPLRELAHDMLSTYRLRSEGFFDPDHVAKLLREHDEGVADHRKALWTLLCFQMWLEAFGANAPRVETRMSDAPTAIPSAMSFTTTL